LRREGRDRPIDEADGAQSGAVDHEERAGVIERRSRWELEARGVAGAVLRAVVTTTPRQRGDRGGDGVDASDLVLLGDEQVSRTVGDEPDRVEEARRVPRAVDVVLAPAVSVPGEEGHAGGRQIDAAERVVHVLRHEERAVAVEREPPGLVEPRGASHTVDQTRLAGLSGEERDGLRGTTVMTSRAG
jgi:hypothetical protein